MYAVNHQSLLRSVRLGPLRLLLDHYVLGRFLNGAALLLPDRLSTFRRPS